MLFAALVACILPQPLWAVTADVVDGVLIITTEAEDEDVTVTCEILTFIVKINGNDPDNGAAACATITEIDLLGGSESNTIDLGTVGSFTFPALVTVTVSTFSGSDIITGTQIGDTLNGGDGDDIIVGHLGNDTMNGEGNEDTMVWNPGDGSDVADGGNGDDTIVVNGGNVSETFTITPSATGAFFQRVSPNPFSVDIISDTERLRLNANGGADIVTGTVGLLDVVELTINGGDGDDRITGGDGDDFLNGDGGNDLLVGFRAFDVMSGGADDDTMVWNPGDGTDTADGGDGNDTMVVNGGNVSETFTISGTPTLTRFDRVTPNPFAVDILTSTEQLLLNANGGGDIVTGTTGLDGVILLTINGGDGDDRMTGGDGDDTMNGDGGNDNLVGFRGADTMNGGADDDVMVWNPGDGSDVANGGDGNDTMVVNGGGVTETFTISGTPTLTRFDRVTPNPFSVDILTSTEELLLNANGGGDIVTGTTGLNGVILLTLNGGDGDDRMTGGDGDDLMNGDGGNDNLVGFRGADTMNGGLDNDTMVWNPGDGSDIASGGDGDDTMVVNGGGVSETFTITPSATGAFFERVTPNPFSVDIISPTERLQLNAGGGGDIVTGTTGLNGVILLTLNGGDGNDNIKGGDGADTLNGDGGNDNLVGFRGNDTMNGGPDDDTLVWNNGDGSDLMDGGDGNDTVVVNGGSISETFAITPATAVAVAGVDAPLVGSVFFQRVTPNPFQLDIEAEGVEVNGNDGNDTFDVTPLFSTTVNYDGGGQTVADILRVNAQEENVQVIGNTITVEGRAPVTHEGVEDVSIVNDVVKIYLPKLASNWPAPDVSR